ncbi:hypothetical protein [Streptomyces mirabilis]|uniref:hypothetical protein n=2 Tax=Streptomyces mirabilis TaxID=68239 RepID=UPI002E3760A7|nr:hypothetical protein [Streptomyces mirabilis]
MDAYELSNDDYVRVQRATMRVLHDCMENFGLDFRGPEVYASKYPKNATMLGWLGANDVDRYGYRGPVGFTEDMAAAARRESRPIVIPESQLPVFEGSVTTYNGKVVPKGGCDEETRRKLNGGEISMQVEKTDPAVSPERGIQALRQQEGDRARSDPRFLSAVRSWSACMRKRGFQYRNPDESMSDPRWTPEEQTAGSPPSQREIATAAADRDCRDEVNFSGLLRLLVAHYEDEVIHTQSRRIHEIAELLKTRARNASKILRRPPQAVTLPLLRFFGSG